MINERLAHGIREALKEIDIRFHYYIGYSVKEAYESLKQKSWKEKAGITAGTGLAFLVAREFVKPQLAYTEEAKAEETAEASVPTPTDNLRNKINQFYSPNFDGDYDKILDCIKGLVRKHPEVLKEDYKVKGEADKHYDEGVRYHMRDEFDKALEEYEKSKGLDPNNPFVYNQIGGIYTERGEFEKAITYFRKAIGLLPNYAVFHRGLGRCYDEKRKTASREEDIRKYARHAVFHYRLSLIFPPESKSRDTILKQIMENEKLLREY